MRLFRLISLAALPIVGLAPSALAGPMPGPHETLTASANVSQVQYVEPAPPALAQDEDAEFQDDATGRCAAQFRSFEPDTGYYTTYDGERVLCPYLQ